MGQRHPSSKSKTRDSSLHQKVRGLVDQLVRTGRGCTLAPLASYDYSDGRKPVRLGSKCGRSSHSRTVAKVSQISGYIMCSAVKRRFLLLYGTQHGQAQAIAEEVSQQAEQHGFIADMFSLKDINQFNLEIEKDPVVFVISTTGTGEPPDAALKFVKKIRNKELPDDYFAHLRYGLLALGDSEYTFFCNGGKIVDKRLGELGARRFYDTGYADDCVGLELVVEPWIRNLWVALEREFGAEHKEINVEPIRVTSGNQNILNVPEHLDMRIQTVGLEHDLVPDNKSLKKSMSDAFEEVEHSLIHSVPPLCQCSLNIPAFPSSYLDVVILECAAEDMDFRFRFPEVEIFIVPIIEAKRLTTNDSVKNALMLEIDISNTTIEFQPGDSFGIVSPNPPDEVTELINKLGLSEKREYQIWMTIKRETNKRGEVVPNYIPQRCSVQYLLTWCLEIRALLKKVFLRALVEYTSDAVEKRRLLELCSKQGNSDYNLFIRDHAISLLDLLNEFPSCQPPLGLLIEHLPKLEPRSYSAASSSLFKPGKLCFIFNVVTLEPCSGRKLLRKGVCTGYLAKLVMEKAEESEAADATGSINKFASKPQIPIFIRPSTSFNLPLDFSAPLIMIGPGTGIAPFIGFLQHREIQRQQKKDCTFGDTWLFFGCRSHDKDYFFRDAKNMAKDVNSALIDILCAELHVEKLDAMKILASLKDEKRYLQDIWC
ncbi:methionine synthase reductase isoform X3 [Engystomops pustulosus]|uniref:methionine synthase reductase isoform X3 n=1 Tax=Engystomops pustulosus TaxID=76066 RepID=UPI003AFB144D